MKHLRRAAVVLGVLVSACGAQVPPINFSVPNVGPSANKIDAELRSVTVTMARPDEKTGDIALGAEGSITHWKEALTEALNRMAIFRDDAPRKVSLNVKVLKLDVPSMGIRFTTETAARYEIIDRSTGAVIFVQDVNSTGSVPGDHAFLAVARGRESINCSVQNNIMQFLQALETVNVNRPMFPAGPAPTVNTRPTS